MRFRKGPIERELRRCRRAQARRVLPLIPDLLDAWEQLPGDVESDPELAEVAKVMHRLFEAVDLEWEES